MSCWALVALKSSAAAKGRLAEILSAKERRQLVERMFQQVLRALREAEQIDGIAVVTNETLPLQDADENAHTPLLRIADPGGGLNAALTHGTHTLAARGIHVALVLHADLPLLNAADIDAMIAAGRAHGLAMAADKLGLGTNALFIPLPAPFPFRFGVGSFALHRAEIAQLGREAAQLERPGLACDIDEPQDLMRLLAENPAEYGFLAAAAGRVENPA
ncbi:MAG: 2-phospho-L-lactate guanylyltransferase [Sterolibacterium sp.]|jgi:2-phospho-L-lactate guanylyltransferase|nr:2-phospho-L-lactate guanylyltransferase [Sterolibacterium sp.]